MSLRLAVKRSISETAEEEKTKDVVEPKKPVPKKAKTTPSKAKVSKTPTKKAASKKKLTAKKASKAKQTNISTDEEEDESEEEDDGMNPEEPNYDSSGYIDEEDQKRLMAMPEMEREKVLFDRHQKREEWKELKELQKKRQERDRRTRGTTRTRAAAQKKKPVRKLSKAKGKKRSNQVFSDSDDEDSDSSFGEKDADSESEAEKEENDVEVSSPSEDEVVAPQGIAQKKTDVKRPSSATSKPKTETSDVHEMEVEEQESEDVIKFEDMSKLQVFRRDLLKWFDKPFFGKVVGSYVRLFIGIPEQNRSLRTYRICEIMDVQPCKPYKIDDKTVDQALVLRFGSSEKTWRMDKVSNSRCTSTEFEFWKKHVKEQLGSVLTRDEVNQIFDARMNQIVNYVFTEQEINEMVERKRRSRKKTINIAMARTEIERNLKAARENGDITEEKEQLKKLKEVEEELKRIKESRHDGTVSVNDRNMRKNISQLNEIVREKQVKKKEEMETGKIAAVTNWNVRAPTRPTTLWSTKPGQGTAAPKKPQVALPKKQPSLSRQDSVNSIAAPETTVSSVHAAINVEINLDADAKKAPVAPSSAVKTVAGVVKPKKKKKGMSLGEYWRRQNGE